MSHLALTLIVTYIVTYKVLI